MPEEFDSRARAPSAVGFRAAYPPARHTARPPLRPEARRRPRRHHPDHRLLAGVRRLHGDPPVPRLRHGELPVHHRGALVPGRGDLPDVLGADAPDRAAGGARALRHARPGAPRRARPALRRGTRVAADRPGAELRRGARRRRDHPVVRGAAGVPVAAHRAARRRRAVPDRPGDAREAAAHPRGRGGHPDAARPGGGALPGGTAVGRGRGVAHPDGDRRRAPHARRAPPLGRRLAAAPRPRARRRRPRRPVLQRPGAGRVGGRVPADLGRARRGDHRCARRRRSPRRRTVRHGRAAAQRPVPTESPRRGSSSCSVAWRGPSRPRSRRSSASASRTSPTRRTRR